MNWVMACVPWSGSSQRSSRIPSFPARERCAIKAWIQLPSDALANSHAMRCTAAIASVLITSPQATCGILHSRINLNSDFIARPLTIVAASRLRASNLERRGEIRMSAKSLHSVTALETYSRMKRGQLSSWSRNSFRQADSLFFSFPPSSEILPSPPGLATSSRSSSERSHQSTAQTNREKRSARAGSSGSDPE